MPEVYIDELFVINLVINYMLLFVTKRIIRANTGRGMMAAGAIIGALYTVLMFFPAFEFMYGMAGKIVFSLCLVGVTYNVKSLAEYVKALFIFFAVNFAFGGAIFAFMSLTGNFEVLEDSVYYNLPLKLFATSAVFAFVCLTAYGMFVRRRQATAGGINKIAITIGGQTATFQCLADSGNTLRDPVSLSPVIVIEYNDIRKILPADICAAIENRGSIYNLSSAAILSQSPWNRRIRLIPFRSVGCKNGMLVGFKPDSVEVNGKIAAACIIGIYNGKIAPDSSYSGLVGAEIVC